jgi:hypothetical protein
MGSLPLNARGLKFDSRIPIYHAMEQSKRLCMQSVKPRGAERRQCLLAARPDSLFCHMHQPAPIPVAPTPSIWGGLIQYVKARFTRNPK